MLYNKNAGIPSPSGADLCPCHVFAKKKKKCDSAQKPHPCQLAEPILDYQTDADPCKQSLIGSIKCC